MTDYWMQQAFGRHKGALHKQLGYPPGTPLPHGLLNEIADAHIGSHVRGHTVTLLLKRRAVAARNARR